MVVSETVLVEQWKSDGGTVMVESGNMLVEQYCCNSGTVRWNSVMVEQ